MNSGFPLFRGLKGGRRQLDPCLPAVPEEPVLEGKSKILRGISKEMVDLKWAKRGYAKASKDDLLLIEETLR